MRRWWRFILGVDQVLPWASRLPTAPGRVSPRRATHFLCWCKESKQRKHLEDRTSMWESVFAAPCVRHRGLFAASRKALLDSATDAGASAPAPARSVTWVEKRFGPGMEGPFAAMDECAAASSGHDWDRWHLSSKALRDVPDRCLSLTRQRRMTDSHMGVQVLSLPTFFAPAKKVGRPPGRNPGRGRWRPDNPHRTTAPRCQRLQPSPGLSPC